MRIPGTWGSELTWSRAQPTHMSLVSGAGERRGSARVCCLCVSVSVCLWVYIVSVSLCVLLFVSVFVVCVYLCVCISVCVSGCLLYICCVYVIVCVSLCVYSVCVSVCILCTSVCLHVSLCLCVCAHCVCLCVSLRVLPCLCVHAVCVAVCLSASVHSVWVWPWGAVPRKSNLRPEDTSISPAPRGVTLATGSVAAQAQSAHPQSPRFSSVETQGLLFSVFALDIYSKCHEEIQLSVVEIV